MRRVSELQCDKLIVGDELRAQVSLVIFFIKHRETIKYLFAMLHARLKITKYSYHSWKAIQMFFR